MVVVPESIHLIVNSTPDSQPFELALKTQKWWVVYFACEDSNTLGGQYQWSSIGFQLSTFQNLRGPHDAYYSSIYCFPILNEMLIATPFNLN